MLKKFIANSLIIFALFHFNVNAQLPVPEGRRLRDIVEDKYPDGKLLIGATTGSWGLNEFIGDVMDREYSYVTPENDFKHTVIRSNPNSWNWSSADAWLNHIKVNNQVLRIHGPIAPQCSNWAKEDIRTAEELSEELDTFMTALCQRYNGVEGIKYLDVVNEIALDDGSWFGPKTGTDKWENPWLKIGQDTDPNKIPLYIKQAFAIANEHAPALKQIINNHCHPGTKGMEKVKETAIYLRDNGYRVDGIGWQAHIDVGWATETNLQHLRELINWCQERNLEFHITEFDAYRKNPTTQSLEQQAYTYKAILDVVLEKLDSLTIGWNSWHIVDAFGWRTEYTPSLFDENYNPKPAYYAFQLALETKGNYTTPYDVNFKIKNAETGEFINGYEVQFIDSSKSSNEDGITTYSNVTPGRYTIQIKKPFFNTFIKKHLNIYSDTTITFSINPAIYSIVFQLMNQHNGAIISSVVLSADTITGKTDFDGNAELNLKPGTYQVNFEKDGYKNFNSSFTILSDTIINIMLEQILADVKFRISNNDQPINNAKIVFNSDTVFTNSLGISSFESLHVDSTYEFYLSKDKYKSFDGNFILKADTTLNIQLQKSVANIQFEIKPEITNPEQGYVILINDTVHFNESGTLKFYDLLIDNEYIYKVYKEGYSSIIDTFITTIDSTIYLEMEIANSIKRNSNQTLLLYPNPAHNTLNVESSKKIEEYVLFSIIGNTIFERKVYSYKISENVAELSNGIYFLNFLFENGEKQIVRFIKSDR